MANADRNDYLVTGNLYDSTCRWTGTRHPVTRSARHCRSTGLSWFLEGTGYWFPLNERGLATSAFDAAAKFSNVIGVPIVAAAVTVWGWRAGFYVTGILSLIYAALFWIGYRDPKETKRLSREEYSYIVEGGAQQETKPVSTMKSLGFLLRQPKVWGLALGFAAYNYSFYLFLSWLPGYLETQLHMSVLKSGFYTIVPWMVATLTDIFIGGVGNILAVAATCQ